MKRGAGEGQQPGRRRPWWLATATASLIAGLAAVAAAAHLPATAPAGAADPAGGVRVALALAADSARDVPFAPAGPAWGVPVALAAAADPPKATPAGPPAPSVSVEDGRLTVDARDADLAQVLREVAERADFHLEISGPLGRVTAAFTAASVEEGLRRLVQDHELMLVYRRGEGSAEPTLFEVQVFASGAPRRGGPAVAQAPPGAADTDRAMLEEISALVRQRDPEQAVPRLAQILSTAPGQVARSRAAWALARLPGPASVAALSAAALQDSVPYVRLQAAQSLRRVAGADAIPALSSVLAGDPDPSVRRVAARGLATLRDPQAAAALSAAAGDSDASVRAEVQRGLARQGVNVR